MSLPTSSMLSTIAARAGKVAVLMGGASAEREISLRSGMAVVEALQAAEVDAVAVDWDGTLAKLLDHDDFDRYFIALHGRGGEDGQIQAALELMGAAYTGTGVLGSALAMDKSRAKLAWLGAGLPTPAFERVDRHSDIHALVTRIGLPLIIKPAREGSSLGVAKVELADDVGAAIAAALEFDPIVIAERFIAGSEYTVAIVGGTALPIIKLETPREFYDYQAKYVADDTRYLCPCGLSPAAEQAAGELALKAFEILDGRGWGRIDFMCDGDGLPWLIELNTVPGMTDHSLVPMAARHAGMSFEELALVILASSIPAGVRP